MTNPRWLSQRLRLSKISKTGGTRVTVDSNLPAPRRYGPGMAAYMFGMGAPAPASPPKSSKSCVCSNPLLASYLVRYDVVKGSIRHSQEEYRCFEHLSEPVKFSGNWQIENIETYHNVPPYQPKEDAHES